MVEPKYRAKVKDKRTYLNEIEIWTGKVVGHGFRGLVSEVVIGFS